MYDPIIIKLASFFLSIIQSFIQGF